ncbi:MAG: hypothetical protein Q7S21_04615 [archaeon]|nr:hypothetical protein [archaeon]
MQQKAVLFSTIVVVISLVVLSLFTLTFSQRNNERESLNTITALNVVNNRFNNILQDIVLLNKSGTAKTFQERGLPFSYDLDKNSVIIFQEFPVTQTRINSFFDAINGYRIFIQDSNSQTTYTGTKIDLNVAQNSSWGGIAATIHFMILPQCLRFVLNDANTALFKGAGTFNNCSNDFNIFNSVKEYDLNIILKNSTDDYNNVSCSFSGFVGCPDQDFSPSNPNPYFDFRIDDANCSNCNIPAVKKIIRAHFDPSVTNTITISCVPVGGSNCTSTASIKTTLTADLNLNFGGVKTFDSVFQAKFRQNIDSFYYSDYNLTVSKPEYNIVKTSRG